MDVKSVFINGELPETMFMQQPPPPMAYKAKLDASLHSLGFSWSKLEHAVYLRGHAKLFLLVGPMSMT
jgi:hypothetical protein